MKLCFIAGANSIHSKRWIEYFTKKGHEIHWISLKPPTEGYVKNVKFYLIKGVILSSIINIKKLVRKIKPDILHIHYAGINGVIGALTGFHPLVLTVWGSDVLIAGKSKIKRPLVKFVLNKADLITCDAEHMKEAMVKLGVNPSKIKIVYFGIDTQKFSPRPKDKKIIQDLNPDNLPLVISLRNLEPVYDVGTLIKSIPLVLKEFSKVRFIIAGKGTEEKKLKNLAKNLKILEAVRFVGWISNDELPRYLASSDIYVSTSLSDAGLSASTAEAMACGLPVIVTDSGENRVWIEDGKNGFVVPLANPKILAEKIIYLIKNRDIKARFGEINRKIIEERNNYYKEMAKMERIYEEILASH